MMKFRLFFPLLALFTAFSCSKKSPDTPPVMVPENLTISPLNKSIPVGDTAIFKAIFFNSLGQQASLPATANWSSSDASIASITQAGVAMGVKPGQVEIKISNNATVATALLTVVANSSQIATITLAQEVEIALNGKQTLTAEAKNINGDILPGKTFTWQSSNNSIAIVDAATGEVTGKTYGTASVTASSAGIISNPAMVQVIRSGAFMGMAATGTGKLKLNGSVLKLETSANFSVQTGPPDLRIYLSNNSGNISSATEVATLTQRSGAQSWTIPAGVSMTQYKYVVVWCKQFGGAYGVAELSD